MFAVISASATTNPLAPPVESGRPVSAIERVAHAKHFDIFSVLAPTEPAAFIAVTKAVPVQPTLNAIPSMTTFVAAPEFTFMQSPLVNSIRYLSVGYAVGVYLSATST